MSARLRAKVEYLERMREWRDTIFPPPRCAPQKPGDDYLGDWVAGAKIELLRRRAFAEFMEWAGGRGR